MLTPDISQTMRRAIKDRNFLRVIDLIKKGEDVDGILNHSLLWTTLLWASHTGEVDIVKVFIDHGANIEITDLEGNTPLILSVINGHTEVVKFLLSKGANREHTTRSGWTALEFAVSAKNQEIISIISKK